MANTPHNEDPKPSPKGKKPTDSSEQLPPLDPNLLESAEFPELDPGLLESAELPAGEILEDPLPSAEEPLRPDSGEVQYGTTPPPVGEPGSFDAAVSFGGMPGEGDLPTAGLSKIQASGDSGSGMDWIPSPPGGSADSGSFAIPTAQPASVDPDLGMGSDLGIGSEHLAVPSKDPSSVELKLPSGTPISSDLQVSGVGSQAPAEVPPGSGTFEPIAPAAGWLDSMEHIPPLAVPASPETQDSGDEPPMAVESSDIFGGGPVGKATAAEPEQSDVIGATAYGEGRPGSKDSLGRPSDVALSFDQPPGGSTSPEMRGNSDLPVAEELLEATAVPDMPSGLFSEPPAGLPFDSARLADAPPLPDATDPVDVPDFGKTPEHSADASSILADLEEADDRGTLDSSAVRLEAPGMERTLSSDHGEGTEFDLTISDALPHELIAEAASDHGPSEWESLPDADMFANDKTAPDVELGGSARVTPIDPTLPMDADPASLSSIFSDRQKLNAASRDEGSEVSLAATPPKGESDSSVEFSDHPEAEIESSASSSLLGRPVPAPQPPQGKPKSKHSVSEFEMEVPEEAEPAMADWSLTHESDVPPKPGRETGDSSILSRDTIAKSNQDVDGTLPEARPLAPKAKDKPKPAPAKTPPKGKTPSRGDRETSDPSVEIDWLAGSSSQELIGAAAAAAELGVPDPLEPTPAPRRTKPLPPREKPVESGSKKGAWLGGVVVGMLVAGGGFAGAYFGGFIPNSEPTTQRPPGNPGTGTNPNNNPGTGTGTPTAADAAAAIRAGDPARARQMVEAMKDATPAGKALAGEAGLFALVQEKGTTIAANHPELVTARENLKALVDDDAAASTPEGKRAAVKAAVQLGISHELEGDRAAAKKVYEDAKAKFPEFADTFDAALDRLAVTRVAEPTSQRLLPADAQQLLFAITLLQADKKDDDSEAGVYFWKAVNKATGERYTEAVEEIKKARAAHVKQAKAKAGVGLNPLSDPLEQIFPRCCDDLKAYWELRAAIYANRAIADLFKTKGAEEAFKQLDGAQKSAQTAMADLKKAQGDLKDAKAMTDKAKIDLKKVEGDLTTAKATATTLQKDLQASAEKIDAEAKARKLAETLATDAQVARVKSEQFIASLAKELQAAKLLPEKYDAAEFLAAQKRTAERATGPNLTTLLPSAMMAVGSGGLSAAQLVDLAERLAKAETTAKTAADKLATETMKLKTDHTAELKKLTDGYATDLKKLSDTHTTDISKLKDDQKAELKKTSDKFALDAKQLKESFDGKVKDLEVAVKTEQQRIKDLTAQFKVDLGNAISPVEALDMWLPLLVELRRPADADPALASATKVIASAAADSEDAAKARTVAGLALLIKNEVPLAKAQLQAAKASPTHKPALAAKKTWALAADMGFASLNDPLAPYRKPVDLSGRDVLTAARLLDAGVKAYREERYTAAVAALGDSVKTDPTNPIAWYYLGAARWATGATDTAKGDFQQGATREAASDMTARTISAAITPIQGAARDAITASRP